MPHNTLELPSDQNVMKSLLSRGTDSFVEGLCLPPRNDSTQALVCPKFRCLASNTSTLSANLQQDQGDSEARCNEHDSISLPSLEDMIDGFFNGPVGDPCSIVEFSFSDETAGQTTVTPPQDFSPELSVEPLLPESEKSYTTLLIQSILKRSFEIYLHEQRRYELITYLNFLLTTPRVKRFIGFYFEYWHPNAAILHPPSFDPERVSLRLLASVVFLGAMYSNDEMEVHIAKKVIDFAELFTFSSEIFTSDSEVGIQFWKDTVAVEEPDACTRLQDLQAGLITVIAQYWAGSQTSRNRAKEERFSQVIKVNNVSL
jgi:hypothetical protein